MNKKKIDTEKLPRVSKKDLISWLESTNKMNCPFFVMPSNIRDCTLCATFFPSIMKENIKQDCPCVALEQNYVIKKVIRLMKKYPELLI